jgi:23S rRNA pseudouridine2457 synthase
MARIVLFNKPYGVLTQFRPVPGRTTLKDFLPIAGIYPAGRLDADSEGLLVLTDDGRLQQRIADPAHKLVKTYWVQVEGVPTPQALGALERGLDLGEFSTRPCQASAMDEPAGLWPRVPPIRVRRYIPTSWIVIELREGKNRQVRRMTAKVGHPTLRLIRQRVGPWSLDGLLPGQWHETGADGL